MKVKLTVDDVEKFKVACEATDIAILEQKKYGKKTVLIVNVKHSSQLYEAGKIESFIEIVPAVEQQVNDKIEKELENAKPKKH